jgi:hypothetical protein
MNNLSDHHARTPIAAAALVWAHLCLTPLMAHALPEFKIENPDEGYPAEHLGYSIAIDGNTMIVGAPRTYSTGPGGSAKGAAWVYRRDDAGKWIEEVELTPSDWKSKGFGGSVSISGDTAIVGMSGSADVYTRIAGVWSAPYNLTASDSATNNGFGGPVSISGDTAVVGASRDDQSVSDSGAVYVFVRENEVWTEQQKLKESDPTPNGHFGWSVCVSGDTTIVGKPDDDDGGNNAGAIYAFTRTNGVWSQGQKLTSPDAAPGDGFGFSVSISAETVFVGARTDDSMVGDSGSAFVFTRSGGVWSIKQKLVAPNPAAGEYFGHSVSVSGDMASVGAYRDGSGGQESGSAYVFSRFNGHWSLQQKLTASDPAAFDWFGYSVAASGAVAAIGAYGDDSNGANSGSAYVFAQTDDVWSQMQEVAASKPEPVAASDRFGWAVSVSGDTAVIGAAEDDPKGNASGSAWVFARENDEWLPEQKLIAPDGEATGYFGVAVGISEDTAIVGARYDDDLGSNAGSAYVFTRQNGTWSRQQKLTASDGTGYDLFGGSVAISGNAVIVGAAGHNGKGPNTGAAYIFTRVGGVWTEQQKLTASDAAEDDFFGYSVSISGDTAIIGAEGNDARDNGSGAAYVFTCDGGIWREHQKLTASDGDRYDSFGFSVSILDSTAIIGAYNKEAAYVFMREGGVWREQQKLTASNGTGGDRFGFSVSIAKDIAAIGAYKANNSSGLAYVFKYFRGVWIEREILTASDSKRSDQFGCSVSVDGFRVLVGADACDSPEYNSGAAYVYQLPGPAGAQSWIRYR